MLTNDVISFEQLGPDFEIMRVGHTCSMADGISFDVSWSLNCTDLYKRGGGALKRDS